MVVIVSYVHLRDFVKVNCGITLSLFPGPSSPCVICVSLLLGHFVQRLPDTQNFKTRIDDADSGSGVWFGIQV